MKRRHERIEKGIYVVHALACTGRLADRDCRCKPTYQAAVWNGATQSVVKKHFTTKQLARSWREDLRSAARAGRAIAMPTSVTVAQALDEFMAGIESGRCSANRTDRTSRRQCVRTHARSSG